MKAKLFKLIPITLLISNQNAEELKLEKPIKISAKDYLGNLKLKLPTFITNLLTKEITISNIIWRKPKETIIETEINLQPLFKKVENYIQLEKATLTIKTDSKIIE